MVPVVPGGAVTCMLNWSAPPSPAQSTAMLPCGVGTLPSAQLRSPGCGCTVQVAYPPVAGWTPRTEPDRAATGVLDQPWARLLEAPNPTRPLAGEMFSHMVPVWSEPALIMSPHSVVSSDSASAVSPAARRASTS